MDEYISRKAAQDESCNRCNQQGHCNHPELCPVMISLKNIPAADVRPVRYGKWEKHGWSIRCSECGYDMPFATRNFCPNCGAEMEEI